MKNATLFAGLMLASLSPIFGQKTLILQPCAEKGKDAVVWSNGADRNYGSHPGSTVYTWTNSGRLGWKRAFLEFDYSSIPVGAVIESAHLSMFFDPNDEAEGFHEHSGQNDFYIQRVEETWDESTITWSNQPETSPLHRVKVPASTSSTQDYPDMDVTELVKDMMEMGNHGFMLRMQNEEDYYRGVILASSDNENPDLHPRLVITYSEGCVHLKPGAEEGKDASVWNNAPDRNYAESLSNNIYTWTNSGRVGRKYTYLEFDQSKIPANAIIESAYLSLYFNPTDEHEGFHEHYGNNEMYIERVETPWEENTITWNNQPNVSRENRVLVPASESGTQDYLDLDISDLVRDMQELGNYGLRVRMVNNNNPYRGVILASSDHPDSELHPEVHICWTVSPPLSVEEEAVAEEEFMEQDEVADFLVYPNPSNGTFHLRIPEGSLADYTVRVFDFSGREVSFERYDNQSVVLENKGMYLIQLSGADGEVAVQKVVVR